MNIPHQASIKSINLLNFRVTVEGR